MSDMYSSQSSSSAHLPPGTKLNGIFEIERHIASGGMGEIYRGHAIETGDAVAIKVMRTDLADNATALALFRKEASALHYIHHDAIGILQHGTRPLRKPEFGAELEQQRCHDRHKERRQGREDREKRDEANV